MSVKVRERTQGKGGWEVDISITLGDGTKIRKRLKSPVKSKSASQRWGEERAQQLALGGSKQVKIAAVPTFAEFAAEFLAHQTGLNKKTEMRSKRSIFDHHLLPAFGSLRLDQIDARVIANYVAQKLTEKPAKKARGTIAPKTVVNHLAVLTRVLKVAKSWKLITEVPEIEPPDVRHKPFVYLGFDDADVYLRTATEHYPAWPTFLLFAIRTGLRLGELLALCWRHIDFTRRMVRVEIAYTEEGGLDSTKNSRARDVPLASDILTVLRGIKGDARPNDLVFQNEEGEMLTRNQVQHVVERTGRLAGLDGMHPHALRHTFASHAVMRGVPLVQVQRWLGHADVTTTCKYAHLSPEFGAEMIERLVPGWSPAVEE